MILKPTRDFLEIKHLIKGFSMRKLSGWSLLLALVFNLAMDAFAQNNGVNMLSLSARTVSRGKNTAEYTDGSGMKVRKITRAPLVAADIVFFKPSTNDYQVQCFFVGTDENTKERFIYDAQIKTSQVAKTTILFNAPTLGGTIQRSKSLPFSASGTLSSGWDRINVVVEGTYYYKSTTTGVQAYGFLIRVLQGGRVLKIASNQAPLRTLAEGRPAYFDAAFSSTP